MINYHLGFLPFAFGASHAQDFLSYPERRKPTKQESICCSINLPEVGIQDAQRENEAREVYCLVKQQMLKVTIPHHYQEGREFEPPEQTARAYKFIFRAQTNH